MSNVIALPKRDDAPVTPNELLDQAKDAGVTDLIILAYDKDGYEYFRCSNPDGPTALWLLARAQNAILNLAQSED